MIKRVIQLSALFSCFIAAILLFDGCTRNMPEETDDQIQVANVQPNEESYAKLRILGGDDYFRLEYRTAGEKQFLESIQHPLSRAEADPDPARYIVLGDLYINANGKERNVVLFLPWGHVKFDGEYKIADLSKLRKDLRIYMQELDDNVFN